MSEMTVHYVDNRQRKKIMNSLWILDAEGCLNPQLNEITLGEQYRIDPLESYLLLRAFMFDAMQETDEMILSVKITGCLRGDDCILNCPAGKVRQRRKRQLNNSMINQTINWQNDVTFKVLITADEMIIDPTNYLPYFLLALAMIMLICILCAIQLFARKRKRLYDE